MVLPVFVSDAAAEDIFRRARTVRGGGRHSKCIPVAVGRIAIYRPEPGAEYFQAADRAHWLAAGDDRHSRVSRFRDHQSRISGLAICPFDSFLLTPLPCRR